MEMTTGVRWRPWSTLPGDILTAISKTITSDIDLLRLRSICSNWRSSFPPPPSPNPNSFPSFPIKLPRLLPLCDWPNTTGDFILNQHSTFRLSPPNSSPDSSHGWLCKVSPTTAVNTFSLLAPLSFGDKINSTPGMLPIRFSLIDYAVSEIRKSYNIDFVEPENPSEKYSIIYFVRRVIVLWNYVADCALAVLVLQCSGNVVCWKFGEEEWIPLDTRGCRLDDLLLFEGVCYAICNNGVLLSFDSELNLTTFDLSSIPMGLHSQSIQQKYLVVCESELYVVAKILYPEFSAEEGSDYLIDKNHPLNIKIIKKTCSGDWVVVRSLGDNVLFLADDASFGLSAKDFKGLQGNCIYLTDDYFYDDSGGCVYGPDLGVFDLDLRSVKSLSVAEDHSKFFWPPPSWLAPCASS